MCRESSAGLTEDVALGGVLLGSLTSVDFMEEAQQVCFGVARLALSIEERPCHYVINMLND